MKAFQIQFFSPLGKKVWRKILLLLMPMLAFVACTNSKEEDPYPNWEARNAQWFSEVYETATKAIAEAKSQYPNGNEWQEYCEWRIYKTLLKSQDVQGPATDYIVCKVNPPYHRDAEEGYAAYTDSVRLYYRGWLMDEKYPESKTNLTVFSQTYYGDTLNVNTSAPLAMPVTSTVEGFMTAIQYMVKDDDWYVYIPQQLAYKEQASDAIPAYSTLLYRMRIERVHKSGTGMPGWR